MIPVPFSALAAVAVVLILVGVLVLILIAVLVGILGSVLVSVLIGILIIHRILPSKYYYGLAAEIVCPEYQDLSLALKIRLAARPAVMAAVIPPAVAIRPPVKIPRKPSS